MSRSPLSDKNELSENEAYLIAVLRVVDADVLSRFLGYIERPFFAPGVDIEKALCKILEDKQNGR